MNPFFTSSSAYSWWYGASGGSKNPSHLAAITNQQFDNKLARISFQLAGLLVRDRIGRDFGNTDPDTKFLNMKIKLFDYTSVGMEGDILNLLESLGLKVEHIKSFDAATHLIQNKLPLDCIVILNGMFQPQQKDILQAFLNFVTEGGRMIILNCASIVTASLFHTKMQPAPASTTVRAPIHIRAEKDLFTGFEPDENLELEYFRYPIDVIDSKDTKVLAMIRSWRDEPLLVKSKVGSGAVYVFVSKLFTKQKTIEDFNDWLMKKGASQVTLTAWQCALKVNYQDAALHAISTFPMMEALGKILWKEHDHILATFSTENGNNHEAMQSEM